MERMEIACFLVLAFMATLYFPVKREKNKLHKLFSALLIMSMLHIVFDGITVYTVNRIDSIPIWINDAFHRLFIGTMMFVFYLIYRYVVTLVEDGCKECRRNSRFAAVFLVIILLCDIILPFTYIKTEKGNYSLGFPVYIDYIGVTVYMILACVSIGRHWREIYIKKKIAVSISFIIQLLTIILQGAYPFILMSGASIMLINLSFYLVMENPDILLAEQVKEEKRKAEEANAAKSIFLSNMSHEIRTPMNAIVGMTEILLRTEVTEEQKEYLINIKSSGNALVSIINDILDISKIEAGKMELVEATYDLSQMLRDIHAIISNRIGDKPVELKFEIPEDLPGMLYGDGLRIRQVIINLLNNAVKFTEEGYVKLTMLIEEKTEEELSLFVKVSDTGQGIREEDLQKLFGAFEQVDKKKNNGKEGTGLGLSISSQLIEMMGGKLEVKSKYGVGSEFFFTICQKMADASDQVQQEEQLGDFTAPEARILIVDDNEMNRKVALKLLSPFQMQIDTADNGKRALVMIRNNRYHLIFMDHMMPVMDGVEAVKCIREMEGTYYKEVPVIALTADAMVESQKAFAEAGMNGFVAKPIDMEQMKKMLWRWLPHSLIKGEVCDKEEQNMKKTQEHNPIQIEGIDIKEGIKNSGNEEMFFSLLGDYCRVIDIKAKKIEKCLADYMIRDYTIEVHALKSASRIIGAMKLSKKFEYLEQLGNAENIEEIQELTPEVLALYRSYKTILNPYAVMQEHEKREVGNDEIIMYLQGLQEAVNDFDLDLIDSVMNNLEECKMPESCFDLMEQLRAYVADVAMENILETSNEMIKILSEKRNRNSERR